MSAELIYIYCVIIPSDWWQFTVNSIYRQRTSVSNDDFLKYAHNCERRIHVSLFECVCNVYWEFGIQPNWVLLIEKNERRRSIESDVAWTMGSNSIEMQKISSICSIYKFTHSIHVWYTGCISRWSLWNLFPSVFFSYFCHHEWCDRQSTHKDQQYKFDYLFRFLTPTLCSGA